MKLNRLATHLFLNATTLLLWTIGLVPNQVFGQQLEKLGRLEIEDGLASGAIFDVAEDGQGGLWIATQLGLHLKRGATISTYTENSTNKVLSDHYIKALAMDTTGQRLWIGTYGDGIFYAEYDKDGYWNIQKLRLRTSQETPKEIKHLICLRDSVLIAVSDSKLMLLDISRFRSGGEITPRISSYLGSEIKMEHILSVGAIDDMLYFFTEDGIWRNQFTSQQEFWKKSKRIHADIKTIRSAFFSNSSEVFFEHQEGLQQFNLVDETILPADPVVRKIYDEYDVNRIVRGHAHNLWFCTFGNGLLEWSAPKSLVKNIAYRGIWSLSKMGRSIFAAGSKNGRDGFIIRLENKLKEEFIPNSIFEKAGTGKITCLEPINTDGSWFLFGTENLGIWEGRLASDGSYSWSTLVADNIEERGKIYNIQYIPETNAAWIATEKGLFKISISPTSTSAVPERIIFTENPKFRVRKTIKKANWLWIGTDEGLWKYDLTNNKEVQKLSIGITNEKYRVTSLLIDQTDSLWVGAASGKDAGLYKTATTDTTLQLFNKDIENVYSLVEDDSATIWAGTGNYVQQIAPTISEDNGQSTTRESYPWSDYWGFSNVNFNTNSALAWTSEQGEQFIFMAGERGIDYFKVDELKHNPYLKTTQSEVYLWIKGKKIFPFKNGNIWPPYENLDLGQYYNTDYLEFEAFHKYPSLNNKKIIIEALQKNLSPRKSNTILRNSNRMEIDGDMRINTIKLIWGNFKSSLPIKISQDPRTYIIGFITLLLAAIPALFFLKKTVQEHSQELAFSTQLAEDIVGISNFEQICDKIHDTFLKNNIEVYLIGVAFHDQQNQKIVYNYYKEDGKKREYHELIKLNFKYSNQKSKLEKSFAAYLIKNEEEIDIYIPNKDKKKTWNKMVERPLLKDDTKSLYYLALDDQESESHVKNRIAIFTIQAITPNAYPEKHRKKFRAIGTLLTKLLKKMEAEGQIRSSYPTGHFYQEVSKPDVDLHIRHRNGLTLVDGVEEDLFFPILWENFVFEDFLALVYPDQDRCRAYAEVLPEMFLFNRLFNETAKSIQKGEIPLFSLVIASLSALLMRSEPKDLGGEILGPRLKANLEDVLICRLPDNRASFSPGRLQEAYRFEHLLSRHEGSLKIAQKNKRKLKRIWEALFFHFETIFFDDSLNPGTCNLKSIEWDESERKLKISIDLRTEENMQKFNNRYLERKNQDSHNKNKRHDATTSLLRIQELTDSPQKIHTPHQPAAGSAFLDVVQEKTTLVYEFSIL